MKKPNKYSSVGGITFVDTYHRDGTVSSTFMVDTDQVHRIKGYRWWYSRGYIDSHNKGKFLRLSRLLLNAPEDKQVDHIDGNPLNNCLSNLRLATPIENMRNQRRKVGASGYKGVVANKGKWQARLTINYKSIKLGTYETPEEAALAYNVAALEHFGEFALVNTVPKKYLKAWKASEDKK